MKPYQSQGFGYRYGKESSQFKVYAKHCDSVSVCLFSDAHTYREMPFTMSLMGDCVWEVTVPGDWNGYYYCYRLKRGTENFLAQDPFAWASSANSRRSAIVDFDEIQLAGFEADSFVDISYKEAIIYETHVRDMTMDPALGLKYPGKFLGVAETLNEELKDLPYGLDYLKKLGITHLHFLPLQDFLSVEEHDPKAYNWGYDPENYFVPEGSYSLNPDEPSSRIVELQEMVKSCHEKGLAVVLDVVYNHTYRGDENPLAILAPLTYYRHLKDGSYANGSGCGNELKTEEPIVRQLIIDSLLHWMKAYHIDGFRFDLMGLMDVETAEMIVQEVRKVNPNALLYGEPWTGGGTPLAWDKQVSKGKQAHKNYALFNDDYRNALKGDNDGKDHGFIQGYRAKTHDILTGLVGSIHFNDRHRGFCAEPWETINYMSAHDNLCFYDKMKYSTMWEDSKIKQATKLGLSLLLLSFGIPFIQAGTEMMRTKHMDHNSYRSSDAVNAIMWKNAVQHWDLVAFTGQLASLRRYLKCFGTFDARAIKSHVHFLRDMPILAYRIALKDHEFATALILINPLHHKVDTRIKLSDTCVILFDGEQFDPQGIDSQRLRAGRRVSLDSFETVVIVNKAVKGHQFSF